MLDIIIKLFRFDSLSRKIRGKNNAIILLYHSPKSETFKKHVQYLNKYYNFISLQQLIDAIRDKNWMHIPANALVFTFDDGHISNYELMPIFRHYNIVPTIYLVAGVVCTNSKFWWQLLSSDKSNKLKYLPNKKRLKVIEERKSKINNADNLPVALTHNQIKEMSEIVDFQSHTKNHPIVTMLDDDELYEELRTPVDTLKEYGLEIQHFAYPNGDFSMREIESLKKYGYSSARTTDIGWNNVNSDLYRLKIMGISDNASISKLRLQISGIFGWILHIWYSKNFLGKKKIIMKDKNDE